MLFQKPARSSFLGRLTSFFSGWEDAYRESMKDAKPRGPLPEMTRKPRVREGFDRIPGVTDFSK